MSNLRERLANMSPEKRLYTLQTLPGHLAGAGQQERLHSLLKNFDFMEAKVSAFGPQPLIEDYKGSDEDDLKMLRDVVARSAHILAREPEVLPYHLYNTLLMEGGDIITPLLEGAREAISDRPWLQLVNRPRLETSHKSLTGVLEHQGEEVLSLAWSRGGLLAYFTEKATGWLKFHGTDVGNIWLWDPVIRQAIAKLPSVTGIFAWSPDGSLLASGSQDNTVSLWEQSGALRAVLRGHTGEVLALAWSPDGTSLASAGSDNTVRLWSPITNECCATLTGHSQLIEALAWSPDGSILASSGEDDTVRLWNPATRECKSALEETKGGPKCLAWSPSAVPLTLASKDASIQTIRLWDSAMSQYHANLKVSHGRISIIAWSPDGSILASGSGPLQIWDPNSGQLRAVLQGHIGEVTGLAWSPDGSILASCGEDGTVWLWDMRKEGADIALQGHTSEVTGLAWSPDGSTLASSGKDGTVRLWNPATTAPEAMTKRYKAPVKATTWSPDGTTLASQGEDETVRLWDSTTGEVRATLENKAALKNIQGPQYRSVLPLAWSPDGATLASANSDAPTKSGGLIFLWRSNGERQASLKAHTSQNTALAQLSRVTSLAWSPDGATLASAGTDNTVRLWDPTTGRCQRTLKGHAAPVISLSWSPNGAMLASADGDGIVLMWEVSRGGRTVLRGHDKWVLKLSWSPDCTLLASAGYKDYTIRLWKPDGLQIAVMPHANKSTEIPSTRRILEMQTDIGQGGPIVFAHPDYAERWQKAESNIGQGGVHTSIDMEIQMAWSPDSTMLASASSEEIVRLWTRTGQPGPILEGHSGRLSALAWSPDGRILASGGSDGTVRLWDPASGKQLAVAHCLAYITALQFSEDGRILQVADEGSATGNRPIPYTFQLSNMEIGTPVVPSVAPYCEKCNSRLGSPVTFRYGTVRRTNSATFYQIGGEQKVNLCRECAKGNHRVNLWIIGAVTLIPAGCALWSLSTTLAGTSSGIIQVLLIFLTIAASVLSLVFVAELVGVLSQGEQEQAERLAIGLKSGELKKQGYSKFWTSAECESLVRFLIAALKNEDSHIRDAAVEALERIGGPQAEDALADYRGRGQPLESNVQDSN